MNIEIANRLVELRKKNNLSQEELAAKLGLSRQAVSKWERAEASPDTDNLICLAKIYNISLDELLQNAAAVEEIVNAERAAPESANKEEPPHEEEPRESKKKSYVHIGGHGVRIGDSRIEKKYRKARSMITGLAALAATIAYILIGAFTGLWHPWWILFLAIPVIESIVSCVAYRRVTKFAYPIIVVIAYLLIGFLLGGWHPWWILFLTIPVFYMAFRPLEKLWLKDKTVTIDGVEVKLDRVGLDEDDKEDEDEDDKDEDEDK